MKMVRILFSFLNYDYGVINLVSISAYIIFILALIFTLPNIDVLKWTKDAKKLFYRSVMVPLLFVFILTALIYVFPDTYKKLFIQSNISSLQMKELVIKDKEGI